MRYSEENFYKIIGEKIRISRQALGISQSELAEKIGLRRTSITNIESGQQKIQIFTLYLISENLKIPIFSLFPAVETHGTDKEKLVSSQQVITSEGTKENLSDSDLSNILKIIR